MTLEELKYGADIPDPKRLGNQIRQSLALRLSESLHTRCFQVHRTIEYAVLERTHQDHWVTGELRGRGLVSATGTSQTFLLLYPFGQQSWYCQRNYQGNYLNSQGVFSKGGWGPTWRLLYQALIKFLFLTKIIWRDKQGKVTQQRCCLLLDWLIYSQVEGGFRFYMDVNGMVKRSLLRCFGFS